jgi:hypothetical protein
MIILRQEDLILISSDCRRSLNEITILLIRETHRGQERESFVTIEAEIGVM